MYWKDLRECLANLEQHGLLQRITQPVSTKYEIAAHIRASSDRNGPAFLFENVKEHPGWRVLAALYANLKLLLACQQATREEAPVRYLDGVRNPVPAARVDGRGVCQEVVWTGSEVDLTRIPICWHSEKDVGPFITSGVQVVRDPETGVYGLGIHRQQLFDGQALGLWAGPEKRVMRAYLKNQEQGKPTPIATIIGAEPAVEIGSCARVPHGVDKYTIAGGLKKQPIELVKCVTSDLEVPANAEMIIEGELLPNERRREAPFGEFPGCYSGERQVPVMKVKAVTMRRDVLYQTVLTGFPFTEDHALMWTARTAGLWEDARRAHPEVKAVKWLVTEGDIYGVAVSIKKRMESEPANVAASVLSGPALVKTCIVVDEDVNIHDPVQLNWVLATRVQWNRDLHVFPNMVGALLDPSSHLDSQTSKMAVDATIPLAEADVRWHYSRVTVPGADKIAW